VDAGTNNGASKTGINLDFPPTGKAAVTDFDLTRYVPTPVTRGTPAAEFTAPQYKGTVTWKPAPAGGSFVMGEPYTAAVTLTGVSGYTLAGVGANAFTHNATVLVSNAAPSGTTITVTIVFPATTSVTAAPVDDLNLAPYLSAPARGGTPTRYFYAPQYTGNVAWTTPDMTALNGIFEGGATYTATVTLTANSGYTLDGVSGFTHAGAVQDGVSYNAGVVTISFPATSKAPITAFSGESGEEDSFIDMIGKAKAENRTYQLIVMPFDFSTESVDLSAADRDITGGLSLTTANSPANVTLDGGGRVIQLSSNGSVITVDSGVTLTLRNITFRGKTGNNAPLIKVTAGGKLILEDGAVITENDNTVNTGGGVLVDGGTLVMTGGTISDNTLSSLGSNGGGVRLTNKGTFIMSGGTISGNTAAENGGGVFLYDSSRFTMSGGTISGNTAAGSMGGGGVFLDHSTFTMSGGTISGNIVSSGSNSTMGGGGVFLANSGTFTKKPADGSLSSGVIYGYIDNSPDGNWVGTRKTDGTGTPNTHTAGRGDVVYYNTDGKYRDSTLGDTDTFSLSGPWDN
jgi:parallel beta-helix repeat protein